MFRFHKLTALAAFIWSILTLGCSKTTFKGHYSYLLTVVDNEKRSTRVLHLSRMDGAVQDVQDLFPCFYGKSLIDVSGSAELQMLVAIPASQKTEGVVICKAGSSVALERIPISPPNWIGAASMAPKGDKIAYVVYSPYKAVNGSLWIYDIATHRSSQIMSTEESGSWHSFPRWGKDNEELLTIRIRRTTIGIVTTAVLIPTWPSGLEGKYKLSPVVSADISNNLNYVLVAWSKGGLVAMRPDGQVEVLLANQWRGDKWLYPNTLVTTKDGKTIAFTAYDATHKTSILYELDITTRSIAEVYEIKGQVRSLYEG